MIPRLAALAAALLCATLSGRASAAPGPRPGRQIEVPPEVMKLYEDKPVIELVTMGIGSLIWERHGHIALCVHYDDRSQDACYNYGIGDFSHPVDMGWGFLRGTGAFWVGKSGVAEMLSIYQYTDRTIWVQPLPLTHDQKQKVIAKLEHDIQEPYKHYAYDHFWDNCTTRVRDILDDAIGGKLAAMREPTDGKTFRDLARDGFHGMHMPDHVPDTLPLLITDIAMGRVTDRVPTYYERMFLPQYLREAVTKLWGIQPIAIYERRGPPAQTDGPSGRVGFAIVILLLTSPAWLTRLLGRGQRLGLAVAVVPYVLLGTVLTALAILSPLSYIRWNETCLVLLPLDLLVLVMPAHSRGYARGRLAMLALLLVLDLVGVLTQPLLAPLLWPAIPLAVVGLWPPRADRIGRAGSEPAGRSGGKPGRRG
ncbi:MAG TPA: DUF4105 domain-containing protein [Kofleriaceae bacterium]|jgi:hypothetical protein|nr:DUF4105 domain-containing protein [Kofleriaceae bacterium]